MVNVGKTLYFSMNRLILFGIVCTLSMVVVEASVEHCLQFQDQFVEKNDITLDPADVEVESTRPRYYYGVASVLDAETTKQKNLDSDFCSLATFSDECGPVLFSKNGNKREVLTLDLKSLTFTYFTLTVKQIAVETGRYFYQNTLVGDILQKTMTDTQFKPVDINSFDANRKAAYDHFKKEIQEPFGLVNAYNKGKLLHYKTCLDNEDTDSFFVTNLINVEKDELTQFGNIKKYTLLDVQDDQPEFLEAIQHMITISPGMPDYVEKLVGGDLGKRIA